MGRRAPFDVRPEVMMEEFSYAASLVVVVVIAGVLFGLTVADVIARATLVP